MSWLDSFLTAGYKSIAIAGVIVAQEQTMNFVSGFTSADDPVNGFTNLTPVGAGAPTGTGVALVSGGNFVGAAGKIDLSSSTYVVNTLGVSNGGTGGTGTAGQLFAATGTAGTLANGFANVTTDVAVAGGTFGTLALTVTQLTGAASKVSMLANAFTWQASATATLGQAVATAGAGNVLTFRSQAAFPTGAGNGGNMSFVVGKPDGVGTKGLFLFGSETVVGSTFTNFFQIDNLNNTTLSALNGNALKFVSPSSLSIDVQGGTATFTMATGQSILFSNRATGENSWTWNVANAGALSMIASNLATSLTIGFTARTTTAAGSDLILAAQANTNGSSGNGGNINLTFGASTSGTKGGLKITNAGTIPLTGTSVTSGFLLTGLTAAGLPVVIDGVSYKFVLVSA